MAKKVQNSTENGAANRKENEPRSAAYFDREIRSDSDVVAASFAVASDLASGRFSAAVGNAIGGNVRNAIKIAELRHKYARGGQALDLLAMVP